MCREFNYMEVEEEVKTEVIKELSKMKNDLVIVSKQSNHPQDDYLYLVVGKGGVFDKYNVWYFNSSTHSLYSGTYDLPFKKAFECYTSRIKDIYAED